MKALLPIALLLAACTGTWGSPGHSRTTKTALTVGYATSSALVACDAGQTVWASNGGRWDRHSEARNKRIAESNPMLGQAPSIPLLAGIATANAVLGYALLQAPLPAWIKSLWFGGLAATEGYIVGWNSQYSGLCGLAMTSTEFPGRDM